MKQLESNLELAQVQVNGLGFILNDRLDRKLVHRAGCEAVGAMATKAYPKIYFAEKPEAFDWLDANRKDLWANCGKCGGVGWGR